jgi:hypothetical protein
MAPTKAFVLAICMAFLPIGCATTEREERPPELPASGQAPLGNTPLGNSTFTQITPLFPIVIASDSDTECPTKAPTRQ